MKQKLYQVCISSNKGAFSYMQFRAFSLVEAARIADDNCNEGECLCFVREIVLPVV